MITLMVGVVLSALGYNIPFVLVVLGGMRNTEGFGVLKIRNSESRFFLSSRK